LCAVWSLVSAITAPPLSLASPWLSAAPALLPAPSPDALSTAPGSAGTCSAKAFSSSQLARTLTA
jgi:hypothetical protein